MELRKANRGDIEAFTEKRVQFVTLIRDISDIEKFRNETRAYLEKHIDEDDLVIFIAVEDGEIVASCMACIFQTPPLPSCRSGRTAELLNVYTSEAYRRKGLAEKLLKRTLAELKERHVEKVILDYTDMGYPLYKKCGFVELEHQMKLSLV